MHIRNGEMKIDGVFKRFRFPAWLCSAPAAVLLGFCVLLPGSQLYAQDVLLKEYIYLNGKLLAVERQVMTLTAEQPRGDFGVAINPQFAQNPDFDHRGLFLHDSSRIAKASVIPSVQHVAGFLGLTLEKYLFPGIEQSHFIGGAGFMLRSGTDSRYWKATNAFGTGGDNDDL